MPSLRSDRAPRACDSCRRLKTRCYPSKHGAASCLRCETQDQNCSLGNSTARNRLSRLYSDGIELENGAQHATIPGTEERLAKLENAFHTLVRRVDTLTNNAPVPAESEEQDIAQTQSPSSIIEQDAPVFVIRGIANNTLAGHGTDATAPTDEHDPVANGTLPLEHAYELLSLFRLHYSRWVNFDSDLSIEDLMACVRTSPLLFYSICLVSARHATRRHTNELAPVFFHEAKRLLQSSLLTTPQSLEFFQASLLLSLWSTTIGQVPLSIDSWLLTSYALQQGWASSMTTSIRETPSNERRLRICCTWNHICLAHLQYCVGTGRKSLLQESQIDRCADILECDVPQFEVRMIAELRLYWIMVTRCCASAINLSATRAALQTWRKQWAFLFDQPRSQFLEMSYNFAVLLAQCRLLHAQTSTFSRSRLNDMVQRARSIINIAKMHTDERTPHLTDHIYHIITFSAITLCQLVTKYSNILADSTDTISLEDIISALVEWLRSIGLTSHISRLLANIIAAHYTTCTGRDFPLFPSPTSRYATTNTTVDQSSEDLLVSTNSQIHPDSTILHHASQDLIWATFFDFNAGGLSWPQSSELNSDDYTPTEESWT